MRFLIVSVIWACYQLPDESLAQDVVSTRIDPNGNPLFDLSTSKAKVNVSCRSSEMLADFLFNEPFWGLLMLDYEADDPSRNYCQVVGNGSQELIMHIPLYECGTKKSASYTFKNIITVLFDQSQVLEQGDQRKTISCTYPVPFAPAFIEIRREDHGALSSTNSQWRISFYMPNFMLLLCFLYSIS